MINHIGAVIYIEQYEYSLFIFLHLIFMFIYSCFLIFLKLSLNTSLILLF